MEVIIEAGATVSTQAWIDTGVYIGPRAHVSEGVRLGAGCRVECGVFIDRDVEIGRGARIDHYALIYSGATIEEDVYLGPHSCLGNHRAPRANPAPGHATSPGERLSQIRICRGASIGAGAIVLPDVTVGAWAMVGAGAVVTRHVPAYGLAIGVPARLVGYVCACGRRLRDALSLADLACPACQRLERPGPCAAEVG